MPKDLLGRTRMYPLYWANTDITGILDKAVQPAIPQSGRRRHWVQAIEHPICPGGGSQRPLACEKSGRESLTGTPVTWTPTHSSMELPLHFPGHLLSGPASTLTLQQSLSRWLRVTTVEINGVRLSTHFFSTVEKYFP